MLIQGDIKAMLSRNLLPFSAARVDPAVFGLHGTDEFAANDSKLPEKLAEARTALHAETLSILEVNIMAAMWSSHPRPLRISEIYLAGRSSVEDSLEPCTGALNHLVAIGLIDASGAPLFRYQLTSQGTFAALYLVIAGVSDKFTVARVEQHPALVPGPAAEYEIDYCHTGCGRIAPGLCDCGNSVCSVHRYNADGNHDPAGSCSACYDEIIGGCGNAC